jgi:hypothetical protein
MRKGTSVTARVPLAYGVYRGHGAAAAIAYVQAGTCGKIVSSDSYSTAIAFDGHAQHYNVATADVAFAVER